VPGNLNSAAAPALVRSDKEWELSHSTGLRRGVTPVPGGGAHEVGRPPETVNFTSSNCAVVGWKGL